MKRPERSFEEAQNAAKDIFSSFRKRTEADQLAAAEKKANHVMRDLDYWINRYIDKDKPMPRRFSGYIEEHSAYRQALRIEEHKASMKKFWPWFWLSLVGLVVFVVMSFIFSFLYVLGVTLVLGAIATFVFGFAGVTHL